MAADTLAFPLGNIFVYPTKEQDRHLAPDLISKIPCLYFAKPFPRFFQLPFGLSCSFSFNIKVFHTGQDLWVPFHPYSFCLEKLESYLLVACLHPRVSSLSLSLKLCVILGGPTSATEKLEKPQAKFQKTHQEILNVFGNSYEFCGITEIYKPHSTFFPWQSHILPKRQKD